MESLIPQLYGADAVEIPGARNLLDSLDAHHVPWAIVTSGTSPLVAGWLGVLKLPTPKHLVVAEDVVKGKPDPTCYAMGRGKLGLEVGADVLVPYARCRHVSSPVVRLCSRTWGSETARFGGRGVRISNPPLTPNCGGGESQVTSQ